LCSDSDGVANPPLFTMFFCEIWVCYKILFLINSEKILSGLHKTIWVLPNCLLKRSKRSLFERRCDRTILTIAFDAIAIDPALTSHPPENQFSG
ncbi:MAG TPA: hypothetical protein DDW76_31660, partial [Cyanobacteria bacterium UBA11369]|nr:hypothetical protein [Cyanobacteria bacterium UBA11369]